METWGLFSVTPVGVALVLTGIAYFVIAGKWVLPVSEADASSTTASSTMDYFHNTYGLDYSLYEVVVPEGSPLVGKKLDERGDHLRHPRHRNETAGTGDPRGPQHHCPGRGIRPRHGAGHRRLARAPRPFRGKVWAEEARLPAHLRRGPGRNQGGYRRDRHSTRLQPHRQERTRCLDAQDLRHRHDRPAPRRQDAG